MPSKKPHHDSTADRLDDTLLALGEQLSDDADRLAQMYPPSISKDWVRALEVAASTSQNSTPATRRSLPWRDIATAASLLIAVGISGWTGWSWQQAKRDSRPATLPNVALPLGHHDSSLAFIPLPARPADRPDAHAEEPLIVPAGLFQSLSPTEQEAFLDLLDSEGVVEERLSI